MRILLPVNIHMFPELLVDAAAPWAERLSATVDLLYVEELTAPRPRVKEPKLAALLEANLAKAHHDVEVVLQGLLARLPEARRGSVAVDHGSIAETIAR